LLRLNILDDIGVEVDDEHGNISNGRLWLRDRRSVGSCTVCGLSIGLMLLPLETILFLRLCSFVLHPANVFCKLSWQTAHTRWGSNIPKWRSGSESREWRPHTDSPQLRQWWRLLK
jgi:hypothetical protein